LIMKKRGLSTVIVTIIMIFLVLVAIAVVWTIVNKLLENSSSGVSLETACINVNFVATKMICGDEACNVTINRKAGGENVGGLKLIFSNSKTGDVGTTVEDISGNIPELGTKIAKEVPHGLTDELPDTVEVAVYFLSESDKELICTQTRKFKF
jgi:hypothetical protein